MPINIGNTFWSIVVASSEGEIIASLEGFRNKLIAVIAFLLVGGVLFAYYGLKAWFIIGEEEKRRSIEEALKASEEKYRKIFEGASEGIYQTTPEGRYLSINPAFARMFGFASPQEMIDYATNIGQQLYVNPKDREEMVRMLRENDKVAGYEVEVYRKDRSRFWVAINIHTVRDASGEIIYYEGTNVDVTERKQVEEERHRYEKLQGVLEMAGAICHEMNQPMQIISGHSEMLLMNTSENHPLHAKLNAINDQIQRMGNITKKLMKIKDFDTQDYAGFSRIININKSIT